jgi:hypothetical protein
MTMIQELTMMRPADIDENSPIQLIALKDGNKMFETCINGFIKDCKEKYKIPADEMPNVLVSVTSTLWANTMITLLYNIIPAPLHHDFLDELFSTTRTQLSEALKITIEEKGKK